jgi:L-fuconolactonase
MNGQTRARASTVDSHQHFWRLSRGDYDWLKPELTELYRDYEPAHLAPLLAETGVAHTILVQAAATVDETRFLLSLAQQHEFIAGVVGWIDCEEPSSAALLDDLCRDTKFVGVRPMVQDIADPAWLLRPTLTPVIAALIEHDLVFDALVKPHHLRTLLEFCNRHPQLTVVLDHAAKPDIARGSLEPWATDLQDIARNTNARCKLSGWVTEAGNTDAAALKPYLAHVLEVFGPQRIMWGSDWPVCEAICGYREWFDLSEAMLRGLAPADRDAIFGGAAIDTYRIDPYRRTNVA